MERRPSICLHKDLSMFQKVIQGTIRFSVSENFSDNVFWLDNLEHFSFIYSLFTALVSGDL